jgi:hypothetical protein
VEPLRSSTPTRSLRYVEPRPYPPEEFARTHAWMVSWGLAPADATFEDVVDNRIAAAG